MRSTIGANAAVMRITEQSKSSSSSWFSAASLRGLIGHHTAPARLMPNTQAKASGSLAEMTATLSPGRTPRPTSAAATSTDTACTSAYVTDRPSVVRQGAPGASEAPLSR
jgi:hypothetical protein